MDSEFSSGSKRKAHLDSEQLQKKARSRVSYSCAECHRRKQKCDRQVPCSHCVARKIPELCKPYTPGKSEIDLHVRVARLEQIIEMALPQYANYDVKTIDDGREPSSDPEESRSSNYDQEGLKIARSPFLEQLQHSSLSAVLEDIPTPAIRMQSLVLECGFSSDMFLKVVKQLPDRNTSRTLVDFYFTSVNYARCPLYEPLFRSQYESVMMNGHNLQPADIRFLPLLFVVLALAMRLCPEPVGGSRRVRKLSSLRYALYWSSRRALLMASAIQTNSLENVLARLLGARFNIFDRQITESWSEIGAAIRTAQALGLHRDPSNLDLGVFQTEYRRRIWSYVYHADRAYAFITGRPPAISDEFTSTRAPLNIDDSVFQSPSGPPTAKPLSDPTPITFVVLRHGFASIVGRIARHFQHVNGHEPYSKVLALEEEIQKYIAALPPCYALANPDTSMDESRPFVPVHRFVLLAEIMFSRIGLHRPYFLRRLDTDTFEKSRQACIASAKHDSKIRRNFYKSTSRETRAVCGGMFRAFQSTMICGIALIIDPNREDAAEMHDILDEFLSLSPEADDDVDVARGREMKIIRFLRSKIVGRDPIPHQTTENNETDVFSNSESSRPLGFPQSDTCPANLPADPVAADGFVQAVPFFSGFPSSSSSHSFGPNITDPNEIAPYANAFVGQDTSMDYWGSIYPSGVTENNSIFGNEQWLGGSDIVPQLMVPMLNGDNTVPNTNGEWSYWEALINQIRVGGPGTS
ncbi:hypothetical protein M422DRAFT_150057 [Sphaerobolus stellatus SS14]|nr:hypothetical protein M422DRAFT_150057 [Sphaerobolus stellatus SS14]